MCRNPLQKSQLCIEIKNTIDRKFSLREPHYFNVIENYLRHSGLALGQNMSSFRLQWNHPLLEVQSRISYNVDLNNINRIDFTPLIINDIN